MQDKIIKFHITSNKDIRLRDLAVVLEECNAALNKINKEKSEQKNVKGMFTPRVVNVEKGSIILDILINLVVRVTSSLIVSKIKERLNNKKSSKKDFIINYHEKNEKIKIDIHIENK